ncbi:hypothetical protein NT01CX_1812 [Clostridium novyi NT]|uniref:Uncharacterized protein n=1 Tax=Clostridium novyi (strain NT) TaxID=386415 RepID=A0PZT3_CLONN|nr:hypothetical protein NT01CX_1812 [Clostridium novyi NT]
MISGIKMVIFAIKKNLSILLGGFKKIFRIYTTIYNNIFIV